jgi:predicted O-methyltransferase YrrM
MSHLSFFNDTEQSRWNAVRGWLLPDAAECLHRYAKESPSDGQVVEIGSFAGKSSVCIGRAIQGKNQAMTCIDLRFQPDFRGNIAGFGTDAKVRLLEGPSLDHFEHWDSPISFLYIDGHHGKGYALADLLLWDMFVLPGGYVALDDTAGFMIGPNMQVQAMTANGGYEFLEERGGISFLRKNHGLSPLACHKPTAAVWFAKLHVASARLGAMDPVFRDPCLPHQPMPVSEWIDRFWHTSPSETLLLVQRKLRRISRKQKSGGGSSADGLSVASATKAALNWLGERQQVVSNAGPTLAYLDACRVVREDGPQKAVGLFANLSDASGDARFVHYSLPIAPVAKLRLAQCHDLTGQRGEAARLFAELDTDNIDPAIREAAKPWVNQRFAIPGGGNPLLREYNLAWLDHKIQVPG